MSNTTTIPPTTPTTTTATSSSTIPPRPVTVAYPYIYCASDPNGICRVGAGSRSIAYAANDGSGTVHYRNTTGANLNCQANTFGGDVSPGNAKACWTMEVPRIRFNNGAPVGFSQCAQEGQVCDVSSTGPADILYGANGRYVFVHTPKVSCDSTTLGDPIPNVTKACYYRAPTSTCVAGQPNCNTNPSTTPSGTSTTGTTGTTGTTSTTGSTTNNTTGTGTASSTTTGGTTTDSTSTTSNSRRTLYIALGILGVVLVFALIFFLIKGRKKSKTTTQTTVTGQVYAPPATSVQMQPMTYTVPGTTQTTIAY